MKTVLAVLLLGAGVAAFAADLRFRSGRIVAAELSRSLPAVTEADDYALPPERRKGTAAVVVMELAPGRMISIHDYLLLVQGREYPAAALRIGDGAFSGRSGAVPAAPGERISLLYFIPSGLSGDAELTLIPAAPPREQSCRVPFRDLGSQNFTMPSRVAKEGALK